ncbi:biotin transporter BioY [Cellulomonas bogoriensis]|uniref:biotin transporter BioY n=1 Tax=Cellulomonas bogoriensis TaxID=301388 RepID=UPI000A062433|nr:biotin transporter BioY [Cellulomonas bogoriensis]
MAAPDVHTPADPPAQGASDAPDPVVEPASRSGRWVLTASDSARIATFAALIAVLGLPGSIALFGNAVPVTLQTLGVMLAGAILGAYRGTLSVLVFLTLVAAGFPLLAGGRGGLGVFVAPSAGYLVGFVAGAAVVGWLTHRGGARPGRLRVFLACLAGGIGAVYAFGIPVQAWLTGLPLGVAALGSVTFLPGDLLKAVVATAVTVGVLRAYPAASPVYRARG